MVCVSALRLVSGTVKRAALEILGWVLLIAGIAALVLPGPGLLMIFFAIAALSHNHGWARRVLDPIERRAKQAARESVQNWRRIAVGVLGGVWLAACGLVWWFGLIDIPVMTVFGWTVGPDLPYEGWATGLALLTSAAVAWVLIADSMRRYRFGGPDSLELEPARVVADPDPVP